MFWRLQTHTQTEAVIMKTIFTGCTCVSLTKSSRFLCVRFHAHPLSIKKRGEVLNRCVKQSHSTHTRARCHWLWPVKWEILAVATHWTNRGWVDDLSVCVAVRRSWGMANNWFSCFKSQFEKKTHTHTHTQLQTTLRERMLRWFRAARSVFTGPSDQTIRVRAADLRR